jgi:hypothetical protein
MLIYFIIFSAIGAGGFIKESLLRNIEKYPYLLTHNPKVIGSNPIPATNSKKASKANHLRSLFLF